MLYTDEFKLALNESIDGPHGYVIARDKKTGKILINKHNMIVKTGKEYLWTLFLIKQDAPVDVYDAMLSNLSLSTAVFSDKTNEVTYTDALTTERGINFNLSYNNTNNDNTSPAMFSEYNGHQFISFTFSITGSIVKNSLINRGNLRSISSLELQLSSENVQRLFSRIRFDTIPISEDSDIEIVYYIYF